MNTQLRPSSSRILLRVRAEMIKAWKEENIKQLLPVEKATKLLEVAIVELQKLPNQHEQSIELFSNIRFAIFNHVPWNHFESRTTVSYFNFGPTVLQEEKSLNKNIEEMIKLNNFKGKKFKDTHKLILDGEPTLVDIDSFQNAWRERWNEYLNNECISKNQKYIPTWNDFLLNYCEEPGTLGIIWHKQEKRLKTAKDFTGDYILSPKFSSLSFKEIYQMKLEEYLIINKGKIPSDCINETRAIREFFLPSPDIDWESPEAVEHSLLSLHWGFGIWGASNFISIPVTYATSSLGRTGVLSLGSTSPLNALELANWSLIANCVLGTLLNLEMEEKIKHKTTNYIYRVGHPIKKRTNSLARYIENTVGKFQDIDVTELKECNRRKIDEHKERLLTLISYSDHIAGFGSLVNFLSVLGMGNDIWTTDRINKWLTEKPIYVRKFLDNIAEHSFNTQNKNLKLKLSYSSNVENLFFACKVDESIPDKYLGKELLSTLLFELIVNAIQHGSITQDNRVLLHISLDSNPSSNSIILTNKINAEHVHTNPEILGTTKTFDFDGAGGETLSGHIMSDLIIGSPRLRRKIYLENENYYFDYIVPLPTIRGKTQ